jgi:hypothetical protein
VDVLHRTLDRRCRQMVASLITHDVCPIRHLGVQILSRLASCNCLSAEMWTPEVHGRRRSLKGSGEPVMGDLWASSQHLPYCHGVDMKMSMQQATKAPGAQSPDSCDNSRSVTCDVTCYSSVLKFARRTVQGARELSVHCRTGSCI